jgi:serine/threonine protein kinase
LRTILGDLDYNRPMTDAGSERGVLIGFESTVALVGGTDKGSAATVVAPAPAESSTTAVCKRERYEERGLLGEGGMGRVQCVWDGDLLREVAVKELRAELRAQARTLELFLWEARITAHLDHPNIVPVHDLGVTPDGHLFFTMKRVRGRSLEELIEALRAGDAETTARFPLPRRLRAFLQLCQAMCFAHERGVLHRDLKPANVMLADHGELLVMDWGLALPLPGAAGDGLRAHLPTVAQRGVSGTPIYMSPEQVAEEELDVRSDVYALGAVLYELVELEHAIQGKTLPAILLNVSNGETREMQHASVSLAAVIRRAMAKDKNERYANVDELADDIETILDGRTPKAENANVLTQATRFYVSRDPAMSKLRVIDVDFLAWASVVIGLAFGARFARFVSPYWGLLLLLGLVGVAIPTWRYFKLRRVVSREHRH